MSSTTDIIKSAMALSHRDRASVALRLLQSLEHDPELVEQDDDLLAAEVARRMTEIRDGVAMTLDGPSAIASIRRSLGK